VFGSEEVKVGVMYVNASNLVNTMNNEEPHYCVFLRKHKENEKVKQRARSPIEAPARR
jgi:hypothetical protein